MTFSDTFKAGTATSASPTSSRSVTRPTSSSHATTRADRAVTRRRGSLPGPLADQLHRPDLGPGPDPPGAEDRVVPPSQAEVIVDALWRSGCPTLTCCSRAKITASARPTNIKRSFEAELSFYGQVFGFTPADPIEPIEVAFLEPQQPRRPIRRRGAPQPGDGAAPRDRRGDGGRGRRHTDRGDRARPAPAARLDGARADRPQDRHPVPDPARPRRAGPRPRARPAADPARARHRVPAVPAADPISARATSRRSATSGATSGPITLLSVGLVLATTVAVAAAMQVLVPGIGWAPAFVLGAIVAPPDAVAATAIFQRLGVPRRVVTILEGESLVNDATALVAYRFADHRRAHRLVLVRGCRPDVRRRGRRRRRVRAAHGPGVRVGPAKGRRPGVLGRADDPRPGRDVPAGRAFGRRACSRPSPPGSGSGASAPRR